jgi:hypothetical protein
MFDRFTKGSNFEGIDSPWDKDHRAHGFDDVDFNIKFKRGHQVDGRITSPDPSANKVVISFEPKDLLFVERCGFYRNPGNENEKDRYKNIIGLAVASFVKESFGSVASSRTVAKELLKIQFHDMGKHLYWNSMKKFIADKNHHQFDLCSLWDHDRLKNELTKVSERYTLDFDIDEKVIHNVVEKIKNSYPVMTRKRAHQVLDVIVSKSDIDCNDLDIVEQAYIESELEKIYDCVVFPYGSNWFNDTAQIKEFLDTYPTYLKHMNPRQPWYNNIKNPFYLTGLIDKPK